MSGGEMSGGGRMGSGSMSTVPFASLETLCVTDNRIEVAADVLNAALITSLRSLLLWGNPIARKTATLEVPFAVSTKTTNLKIGWAVEGIART
jgi:hypothetical protein